MNMTKSGIITTVTLSRRNLEVLVSKLGREESHRTLMRRTDDGILVVIAEADEDHYKDRTPGVVHPADAPQLSGQSYKE